VPAGAVPRVAVEDGAGAVRVAPGGVDFRVH